MFRYSFGLAICTNFCSPGLCYNLSCVGLPSYILQVKDLPHGNLVSELLN